jgi:hypothetical protein
VTPRSATPPNVTPQAITPQSVVPRSATPQNVAPQSLSAPKAGTVHGRESVGNVTGASSINQSNNTINASTNSTTHESATYAQNSVSAQAGPTGMAELKVNNVSMGGEGEGNRKVNGESSETVESQVHQIPGTSHHMARGAVDGNQTMPVPDNDHHQVSVSNTHTVEGSTSVKSSSNTSSESVVNHNYSNTLNKATTQNATPIAPPPQSQNGQNKVQNNVYEKTTTNQQQAAAPLPAKKIIEQTTTQQQNLNRSTNSVQINSTKHQQINTQLSRVETDTRIQQNKPQAMNLNNLDMDKNLNARTAQTPNAGMTAVPLPALQAKSRMLKRNRLASKLKKSAGAKPPMSKPGVRNSKDLKRPQTEWKCNLEINKLRSRVKVIRRLTDEEKAQELRESSNT